MFSSPDSQTTKLQAVLCDMDGTLVDSNALHAAAWQESFAHFGISVSFDAALHQIGKGGDQLIPVFVPHADVERLKKSLEEYRKELFASKYFNKITVFPGVRDVLQRMKASGLRIAIASSASQEDLAKLKEMAAITDLVEEESSKDDANKSKPEPDIFESTLARLNLPAQATVALGDTPWDIQAAAKAGLATVAVTSGGWKEAELREAGALEVYRDIAHLGQQLENSVFGRGREAKVEGRN